MNEWERQALIYINLEEIAVRRIAHRLRQQRGTPITVLPHYSDGEVEYLKPVGWAIYETRPVTRRFLFWSWQSKEDFPLAMTYSHVAWDEVTFVFKILEPEAENPVWAETSDLRHLPHSKLRILGTTEKYVPPESGWDFFPAA